MAAYDRYADIDGTHLSIDGCWDHNNIEALLSGPSTRGENRVIPGVAGRRAKPRRADETPYTINLTIYGVNDPDGDPYDDPEVGVGLNITYLRENVTDPIAGDGLRTLTLHWKEDLSFVGSVQVVHFEVLNYVSPSVVEAAIEVVCVDGALAIEVAS